jgi:GT2 family glycosyltransferase
MLEENADRQSLSVVIVNWNAKSELSQCLRSLEQQTDLRFEVIVVDNGSTDGSLELLREQFPSVLTLATGSNLGFAEGVNRGLASARGRWIATLNNDSVADPHWIEQLRAAAAKAGAEVGMLQSHMVFRDEPDRINSTGMLLFPDATAADRGFGQAAADSVWSEEIFCPTAGAAAYRRAMLDEVALVSGTFDRDFFMYFEDADLGWRCRLAGWSARYVREAVVRHAFQGSSRRHGSRFVPLQCKRNRLRTLAKNASLALLLRSSGRSLRDLWWIASHCGPGTLSQTLPMLRGAFAQRAAVTRLLRTSRQEVERTWLGRQ